MGHRSITETMIYVHVASAHQRPLPEELKRTHVVVDDPDRRITVLLGQRASVKWDEAGSRCRYIAGDEIEATARNEKGPDLQEVGA
jgi:hypothetical protein